LKKARTPGGASAHEVRSAADRLYRLKAELFRTLGHPVRMHLVAVLGDGERSVGELQGALGLESSGPSQHLAALRRQGLVDSRREGTTVYYWVKDPRTGQLLELARQILTSRLSESGSLLRGLDEPAESERADERAGGPGTDA
jgi:DNA-binding transcriptional ArsR family regulator